MRIFPGRLAQLLLHWEREWNEYISAHVFIWTLWSAVCCGILKLLCKVTLSPGWQLAKTSLINTSQRSSLHSYEIFFTRSVIWHSVDERWWRSWYELSGRGGSYRGSWADCVAYVSVVPASIINCEMYKLTLSDEAQVTLQLRESLSDLV